MRLRNASFRWLVLAYAIVTGVLAVVIALFGRRAQQIRSFDSPGLPRRPSP